MLSFVQRLQVEQVPCVYQHWYGEENGRIVWNDKSSAEARNCMELYYLRNLSCQTEVQNDSAMALLSFVIHFFQVSLSET